MADRIKLRRGSKNKLDLNAYELGYVTDSDEERLYFNNGTMVPIPNNKDIIELKKSVSKIDGINSQLNDNTKHLSNSKMLGYSIEKYKGSAISVPELASSTLRNTEFIDRMVESNCNIVSICPVFWVSNETSQITGYKGNITSSDVLMLCQYAKSNGLKVLLKPHVTCSNYSSYASIAPTDLETFMTSYSSYIIDLVTVCKDYIDIVSITCEMDNQTNKNVSSWKRIINDIRSINPNLLITNASRIDDLQTNVFLNDLDIIGCNLYAPIIGDLSTSINLQMSSVFTESNYLNRILQKAKEIDKKIILTEVGILPSVANFSNPSSWTQLDNVNYDACIRYYSFTVAQYLNSCFSGVIINGNEYLTNSKALSAISNIFSEVK